MDARPLNPFPIINTLETESLVLDFSRIRWACWGVHESEDKIINHLGNDPRPQITSIAASLKWIVKQNVANLGLKGNHIPSWKYVSVFLELCTKVHLPILDYIDVGFHKRGYP